LKCDVGHLLRSRIEPVKGAFGKRIDLDGIHIAGALRFD
jgi:hypothetical protein